MNNDLKNNRKGVASLPTVVVLTLLILSLGIMIASVSLNDIVSSSGLDFSAKASAYAKTGARDGLERVARNKGYNGSYSIETTSGGCSAPYSGCVTVAVDSADPKTIDAQARVGDFYKKIQVKVNLDSNGLITGYSWQEL